MKNKMVFGILLVQLAFMLNSAQAAETKAYRYQYSKSWSKPSSESHAWSFAGACDGCLKAITRWHGVDWKITDVEYEDRGRSTRTSTDRLGRRTWRCTHTVVARYKVVHRGLEKSTSYTVENVVNNAEPPKGRLRTLFRKVVRHIRK